MTTLQIKTHFSTLLRLAREEYLATQTGDKELIEKAKEAHEAYRQLCLKHDMEIGLAHNYIK